jgi:hypothetical protein
LSVDPLTQSYPWYTPYQFAGNMPIRFIDLDGLEPAEAGKTQEYKKISPKDKYEEGILKGKIVYTKNYGWVDMTHAFTPSKRDYVSAVSLWKQIDEELGEKITVSSSEGHLVIYKQDAKVLPLVPPIGITRYYWVKNGLSQQEKKEIALRIFEEVSVAFETLQGFAFWSGSSFEPADLPSNILGFYMAVEPELTKEKIIKLIEPLTPNQSLDVYRQYDGTFTEDKYKNRSFTPVSFPNKYAPNKVQIPAHLKSIKQTQVSEKNLIPWMLSIHELNLNGH